MTLPIVRVDNWLLFPGGYSRPMTIIERIAWRFGFRPMGSRRLHSPLRLRRNAANHRR